MAQVNQCINLYRDEPVFDPEVHGDKAFPWRCDIWEENGDWTLFAAAWGKTQVEARSKANSIVQSCAIERWTTL